MHPFIDDHRSSKESAPVSRRVARGVWLTIVGLLAALFATVLAFKVAPVASAPEAGHWPSDNREVAVVDRTGDPAWQRATRWAVERWNRADVGVRLTWTAATGPCDDSAEDIEFCPATKADLARLDVPQLQGLVEPDVDRHGHFERVQVLVCADCRLGQARRKVVTTHELGHALGLSHADGAGSLMHPSGGSDHPHRPDIEALRSRHAHTDSEKDCLAGDVVDVGSVCF